MALSDKNTEISQIGLDSGLGGRTMKVSLGAMFGANMGQCAREAHDVVSQEHDRNSMQRLSGHWVRRSLFPGSCACQASLCSAIVSFGKRFECDSLDAKALRFCKSQKVELRGHWVVQTGRSVTMESKYVYLVCPARTGLASPRPCFWPQFCWFWLLPGAFMTIHHAVFTRGNSKDD